MIKITTYWSLVKFCDIWLSFVICDVLILYGMFSDGTFSHGMIRDGGTFCVGLVLCYKSPFYDCRFIPAWYLTIYIREKVEICEKKRWKKNTPNVGGENAAKVSWQKIRQNVNNSVESWRLLYRLVRKIQPQNVHKLPW